MIFHRNAWYVVAQPDEVTRALRRRVVLNEPLLLYRTEAGDAVALRDRCPHRFAPLSRGRLLGDIVQCGYHGLQFSKDGHCVHNPHGEAGAPRNRVHSYPAAERHGLIWAWMGEPSSADSRIIPDMSYLRDPSLRTVHGYLNAPYRYDVLVDNLLDLSHADYLHVGSFMGGACGRSETTVREAGPEVYIVYTQWDAPAPPGIPGVGDRVDQAFHIHWHPGQVMTFEYLVVPKGGNLSRAPKIRFAHIATPQTDGTTHYFMSFTRDYALDDLALDAQLAQRQRGIIESEDGPMLQAIDGEMAGRDLLELRPLILPTDTGALRVRRVMQALIAADATPAAVPVGRGMPEP